MAVNQTITVNSIDYGFDYTDSEIEVEATADDVSADDLKQAIRESEWSATGIVFADVIDTGNPIVLDPVGGVSTALNIILQGAWRLLTLKTSGTFTTTGGNVVRHDTGVDIFATNNLVTAVNNVSQAGTRINSAATDAAVLRIEQFIRNRQIVDGVSGKMEIQDDTDTAVLWEADIWEDDGTTAWDGTGPIVRRDRFEAP